MLNTLFVTIELIATFLVAHTAFACSVCFAATADSYVKRGLALAIITLLMIVLSIMGGVIAFFVNVSKRTKMSLK